MYVWSVNTFVLAEFLPKILFMLKYIAHHEETFITVRQRHAPMKAFVDPERFVGKFILVDVGR